ncbi:SDR family oxidoreductase [Mycobacterium bourgelatii]|uniref:Oxidoreductase n=1 Tax=Mycobacterium bourgelatii TaxID=1273442 RepID=A0A7I9YQW7_MYCBU|nr:SDR family oxidoreductase [Mycobacterium bourgelatii]MCV6974013.1 SDR family oxidoreductase [Mycobacterium bourgelatii]GFG90972.1 oxidoreductase [Mycobacterium bourgelatii]
MTTPKVAFVTGASSGIGRAITTRLAADGLTVVAAARRTELLDELAAGTDTIEAQELDVTDRDAVRRAVDDAVARHGRLDVFVANAGVMPLSRLDSDLVDEWDTMIDVNIRGLLHGISASLPHFRTQGSGHFVTTASVGSYKVTPTAAVYCGTKYAAWAITEGLRQESPPGIRVTTVSPGVVESELANTISDPHAKGFMKEYRKYALDPAAIAAAVSYAVGQPADVDVNEMVIRPVRQR